MAIKDLVEGAWTCRSGNMIPIKDMTDTHLQISIRMTSMLLSTGKEKEANTGDPDKDRWIKEANEYREDLYKLRNDKLSQLLKEYNRRINV